MQLKGYALQFPDGTFARRQVYPPQPTDDVTEVAIWPEPNAEMRRIVRLGPEWQLKIVCVQMVLEVVDEPL